MKTKIATVLLVCSFIFCVNVLAQTEQVIVFLQGNESKAEADFLANMLPQIVDYCQKQDIELLNIKETPFPQEVTHTPFIAFQNPKGRSYYSGQNTNFKKFKNFVRSSRMMHQSQGQLHKEKILVGKLENQALFIPIKITALTGKVEDNHDATKLEDKALADIDKALKNFVLKYETKIPKLSKLFYWAIYPYRDERGNYWLSGEIYSQYNCETPVYQQFEKPISSKNLSEGIAILAQIFEKETLRIISENQAGLGFSPIPQNHKNSSWQELGLSLPKDSLTENNHKEVISIFKNLNTTEWTVAGATNDKTPMIFFHFPEPIDQYTGEVTTLEGTLKLPKINQFLGAAGEFSIPVDAITMGDKALDEAIHRLILNANKNPTVSFSFENLKIQNQGILPSSTKVIPIQAEGTLTLNGISQAQKIQGAIEPSLDENDTPQLLVRLKYSVSLKEHNLKKFPDGPSPERESLVFLMLFLMKPS